MERRDKRDLGSPYVKINLKKVSQKKLRNSLNADYTEASRILLLKLSV